ncbi:hypothetical protein RvY_04249 [Ramazzottius varieornatus]|uniref:Uncharacterized protein n=1 Tax=Ramazzottius varieornatus TaxID=947166 RepID=A0A1D1URP6_RAMVA|nr:hypothetical protein RvY_04249 [Ramazzottius varieornatus]
MATNSYADGTRFMNSRCNSPDPGAVSKNSVNSVDAFGGAADDYVCHAYHRSAATGPQYDVVVRGYSKKSQMTVPNYIPASVKDKLLQTNGPVCYSVPDSTDTLDPVCLCHTVFNACNFTLPCLPSNSGATIRSDQIRSDPIRSDPIRSDPIRSDQIQSHRTKTTVLLQIVSHNL